MDPFVFIVPHLHDLVLQHFKGSECLKDLSVVSPLWSEIVGKSKTCMNKVKFLYQVWRHQFYSSTEVFQCAINSCRNYQHIIIDLGVNDDSKLFWKFIEYCSGHIVTLKVENVRRNVPSDLSFHNLESLRVFGVDETSLETILKSTKKLKELFIFTNESSVSSRMIDTITNCIQQNKTIEEIYFKNIKLLEIFHQDFHFDLQLRSLKLMSTGSNNSIPSNIENGLLKFLKSQCESLKTFFFEFTSEKIAKYAFSELPQLTSLGLLNFTSIKLQKNHKITNLELPYTEELSHTKNFIDATPNLETLFVGNVSNDLIDYLAWNFMKLQSLNFKMIHIDAEEHYEKLKNEHPEVNQNIDIWDYENIDWD